MRRLVIVAILALSGLLRPASVLASSAVTVPQSYQVPVTITPPLPAGATALYQKLEVRVPARLQPWLTAEATKLSSGRTSDLTWPSPNDPALAGQNLPPLDIEALAFIMMMKATQGAESDLSTIMDQVKAQTAAKAALRRLVNQMNADVAQNAGKKSTDPCNPPACGANFPSLQGVYTASGSGRTGPAPEPSPPATIGALRALDQSLKDKFDSMNEMSEMTSLRLQMVMDRRAKFVETLSNVMKKIASASDAILKNLK